jgi:hypothetical protein
VTILKNILKRMALGVIPFAFIIGLVMLLSEYPIVAVWLFIVTVSILVLMLVYNAGELMLDLYERKNKK